MMEDIVLRYLIGGIVTGVIGLIFWGIKSAISREHNFIEQVSQKVGALESNEIAVLREQQTRHDERLLQLREQWGKVEDKLKQIEQEIKELPELIAKYIKN